MAEPDPQLRRIERSAFWMFAILVVVAAATGGGVRAVARRCRRRAARRGELSRDPRRRGR